jgi:hypothetical protein
MLDRTHDLGGRRVLQQQPSAPLRRARTTSSSASKVVSTSTAGGLDSARKRRVAAQRIRPVVNQYEVSALGSDESPSGEQVCFVEQKRMKLKEVLRAYTAPSKTTELFRIKAQQIWGRRADYDVTDANGRTLGQLAKVFGRSLFRSTWRIYDPEGNEIGWARERSLFVAVFRRAVG